MGTAPFFYRDLNFKSAQPSQPWTPAFRAHVEISAQNAYRYARNARIDSRLNWNAVAKYLSKCHQWERLDWAYWDDITPNTSPIPPPIQDFLRTKSPPVRLYIWRCSIPKPRGLPPPNLNTPQYPHIASMPTSNLVGLSLTRPVWRSGDAHEVMMGLVTSSPQLESLELFRMSNKFYGNKKLPPIKHLSLCRYNWPYTADEASEIWDFSRLESLQLRDSPNALQFLQSVSSKQLPRLKKLSIEGLRLMDNTRLTEAIGQYLLDIPQLLEIDLTCQLRSLLIPSIARHRSLRRLSLKEYCSRSRGEVVRTLAISELRVLQAACKHIAELALDIQDCSIFLTHIGFQKFSRVDPPRSHSTSAKRRK